MIFMDKYYYITTLDILQLNLGQLIGLIYIYLNTTAYNCIIRQKPGTFVDV